MIIVFFVILIIVEEGVFFVFVFVILVFVDVVLFFVMFREDFDCCYNKDKDCYWYGRYY